MATSLRKHFEKIFLAATLCAVVLARAYTSTPAPADGAFSVHGGPAVPVPPNNRLNAAKVALGEQLFFETGLSVDHSVSCSSCHKPDHFFSDDKAFSKGVGGQVGDRNALSVLNAAYFPQLMWDGRSISLEDQVRYPITHPREMNNSKEGVVKFLSVSAKYPPLFKEAFGDSEITWDRIAMAIASFERTLVSQDSPFDRAMSGDKMAISESAKRGFELFRGAAGCIQCHRYDNEHPFFSDSNFHNTGVSWEGSADLGRYEITKAREEKGAFRTPSLRNVARTAPYMHDGSMKSLAEVLDFYSRGGQKNPFLDEKIKPLSLTAADKEDIIAFLESLTGEVPHRSPSAKAESDGMAPSKSSRGSLTGSDAHAAAPAPGEASSGELMPKSYPPFGKVEVVAGTSDFGDGEKALHALFVGVGGIALDHEHNIYITDSGSNRIRKIDAHTGIITTVAGNGLLFAAKESPIATEQPLHGPVPLAIDGDGRHLFVGEIVTRRVKHIDLVEGTMEDLGAPAGGFGEPNGLSWTSMGLIVVDGARGQLWNLNADHTWTGLLPDGARLRGGIRSVVEDAKGGFYIVEYFAHRVLHWDPASGRIDIVAGTGEAGLLADGAQGRQSPLHTPDGMLLDHDGNLIIADKGNHRICRLDHATGRLETIAAAGDLGTIDHWTPGPIAMDSSGILWIGDIHLNRVLRYAPGEPAPSVIAGMGSIRDDGPALAGRLAHPGAVASDSLGNLYVSDTLHHRVRFIDARTKMIRTLVGTGIPGYNGDGIPARDAWLGYPGKLQLDAHGHLYIGDYYNNRVRRVNLVTGSIFTIAGNGVAGESGDNGPARAASLINPHALLLQPNRSLIIASAVSSKLRSLDLTSGLIHAVPLPSDIPETLVFYGVTRWNGGLVLASPRPGSVDFLKDGKLSRMLARPDVVFPQDVAVSPRGELYICEAGRNRILRWDGKTLEVVVENLGRPRSISFDLDGNLLIADTFHNRILRVSKMKP